MAALGSSRPLPRLQLSTPGLQPSTPQGPAVHPLGSSCPLPRVQPSTPWAPAVHSPGSSRPLPGVQPSPPVSLRCLRSSPGSTLAGCAGPPLAPLSAHWLPSTSPASPPTRKPSDRPAAPPSLHGYLRAQVWAVPRCNFQGHLWLAGLLWAASVQSGPRSPGNGP